jgi:linoleoyl-CoA desaturase
MYFSEKKINQKGNWKLYSQTILLFTLVGLFYYGMLHAPPTIFSSIVYGLIFGFLFPMIGFNVMHDAAHGAYSEKELVNKLLAHSNTLMGVSLFMWKKKHNVIHHTFTNTEVDDDLSAGPAFRFQPTQPWKPGHRFQHIYALPAYGLLFFIWVWRNDFRKYFSRKIHTTEIHMKSLWDHIIFWGGKVFHFMTMVYIPCSVMGFGKGMLFYLVFCALCGFLLSIVFQLAHVVEKTIFPRIDVDPNKITTGSWAANQILTTCNFATKNVFLKWFVGGLNFQIEHHLFPEVSHVHYPAIQSIVQKTCEEYDLPYNEYGTMRESVISHLATLKGLGSKP